MLSRKKIAFSTWSVLKSVFHDARYITASLQAGWWPSETVELEHCINNISIWEKHVAQQLIMLLQDQQWMFVIA